MMQFTAYGQLDPVVALRLRLRCEEQIAKLERARMIVKAFLDAPSAPSLRRRDGYLAAQRRIDRMLRDREINRFQAAQAHEVLKRLKYGPRRSVA